MPIPIEFVVKGAPASVNEKCTIKINTWKNNVALEANAALHLKFPLPPVPSLYPGDLTAKFFFFPHNNQYIDIDNGVKRTLDAMAKPTSLMTHPIINNDKSVQRIIVERIRATPGTSIVAPVLTAVPLLDAFNIARGHMPKITKQTATAIMIEAYICNNGAMW